MNRSLFTMVLVCLACGGRREQTNDTGRSTTSTDRASSDSRISFRGVGPLRIGMTLAEARAATGTAPSTSSSTGDPNACSYAQLNGLPEGVSAMIEGGRVVRLDVNSGSVPTAEGIRVGDTEDRVKSTYGNRVTVTPHTYTAGHYLTVRTSAQSDSAYRIVFETDGRVVTKYRVGTVPSVEYVEGCG